MLSYTLAPQGCASRTVSGMSAAGSKKWATNPDSLRKFVDNNPNWATLRTLRQTVVKGRPSGQSLNGERELVQTVSLEKQMRDLTLGMRSLTHSESDAGEKEKAPCNLY